MAKNNFILSDEWKNMFTSLPDEAAGRLIKAVFLHHAGDEVVIDEPVLAAVYEMIRSKMDDNERKYAERCAENAVNGRKGGEATAAKRQQTVANGSERKRTVANASETQRNVADNDSDNDLEKLSSKEDSKKKPAPKEKPMHFGDLGNVLLTETEHAKLIADYGQQAVDDAIKFLDEYIADKGYKHKSPTHNLAMRRWVFDALNQRKAPPGKIRPIKNGYSERTYDYDAIEKDLFNQMLAE